MDKSWRGGRSQCCHWRRDLESPNPCEAAKENRELLAKSQSDHLFVKNLDPIFIMRNRNPILMEIYPPRDSG